MNKYLDLQTIRTYLNLGKTIEVFLGRISEDKDIISYLDLQKTKSGDFEITCYELYDEGNLDFLDVYSFSFVDPEMDFETYTFENIDLATKFIHDKYNLNEIRFLNAGLIQDEYKRLLIAEAKI